MALTWPDSAKLQIKTGFGIPLTTGAPLLGVLLGCFIEVEVSYWTLSMSLDTRIF